MDKILLNYQRSERISFFIMKCYRGFDNQSFVYTYSIQKTVLVIIFILMIKFVNCDERDTSTETNIENEDKSADEAVNYDEYPVGCSFDINYKDNLVWS